MSIAPRRLLRDMRPVAARALALVRSRAGVCARDLSVWGDIRAVPPLAVWGGVGCVAAMLMVRRVTAPASLKLSTLQLGVTATIAGALAVGSRLLLARIEPRPPALWLRVAASVAAALPVLTVLAGSSHALSPAATGYVFAVAALSAGLAWLASRPLLERLVADLLTDDGRGTAKGRPAHAPLATVPTSPERSSLSAPQPGASPSTPAVASVASDAGSSRQSLARLRLERPSLRLERLSDPADGEKLQGSVMADFAAGQGLATVHLAFQPPFPHVPSLDCQLDDGSPARVKLVSVYPYGARLELKRGGSLAAPARCEIRFSAVLSVAVPRAA